MIYLMKLVALKKYIDKQNQRYTHRGNIKKEKTRYEKAIESEKRSLSREITFIKAIRFAVGYDHDKVLSSFFNDLYEYGKKLDYMDCKEYIEINNDLKDKFQKIKDKLDNQLNQLQSLNIKGVSKPFYNTPGMTFYNDPNKSGEVFTIWGIGCLELNGITILEEDLADMKLSEVEKRREEIHKELAKYQDEEKLKIIKEKLEKKFFIFDKKKHNSKIKQVNQELNIIENYKKELLNLDISDEIFSSLTKEQIEAIKNINETLLEMRTFIEENRVKYIDTFDMISAIFNYSPHRKYGVYGACFPTNNEKRNRCERCLKMMEDDGKFSDERIAEITASISKTIEKLNEGYYHKKIWMYSEFEYLKDTEMQLTEITDFFKLVNSIDSNYVDMKEVISKQR